MRLEWICSPLKDEHLFQDDPFFGMPDDDPGDDEDDNTTTVEDIDDIKRVCKNLDHKQIIREVRTR